MKNFEKWEKEILEIVGNNQIVALHYGKPVPCTGNMRCSCCGFSRQNTGRGCGATRIEWLYSECAEEPKLTKKEKTFVGLMGRNLYLARDAFGYLFLYEHKPRKEKFHWNGRACSLHMQYFNGLDFSFISWEDKEPWSIEALLGLEVEE